MEFDPESFMSDVTAALQHPSPHSRSVRLTQTASDAEVEEMGARVREEQEDMYPASKRRRLSGNTESSPESFDIGEWLTAGNEVVNLDGGSDSEGDDDVPSFFHPSMLLFLKSERG